ncbi:hypothetical protein BGX29_001399 [Mortierella sp. GBA35]|nr:hypothetical protein BGX29_001399 [Mortierella sp. GBA35]
MKARPASISPSRSSSPPLIFGLRSAIVLTAAVALLSCQISTASAAGTFELQSNLVSCGAENSANNGNNAGSAPVAVSGGASPMPAAPNPAAPAAPVAADPPAPAASEPAAPAPPPPPAAGGDEGDSNNDSDGDRNDDGEDNGDEDEDEDNGDNNDDGDKDDSNDDGDNDDDNGAPRPRPVPHPHGKSGVVDIASAIAGAGTSRSALMEPKGRSPRPRPRSHPIVSDVSDIASDTLVGAVGSVLDHNGRSPRPRSRPHPRFLVRRASDAHQQQQQQQQHQQVRAMDIADTFVQFPITVAMAEQVTIDYLLKVLTGPASFSPLPAPLKSLKTTVHPNGANINTNTTSTTTVAGGINVADESDTSSSNNGVITDLMVSISPAFGGEPTGERKFLSMSKPIFATVIGVLSAVVCGVVLMYVVHPLVRRHHHGRNGRHQGSTALVDDPDSSTPPQSAGANGGYYGGSTAYNDSALDSGCQKYNSKEAMAGEDGHHQTAMASVTLEQESCNGSGKPRASFSEDLDLPSRPSLDALRANLSTGAMTPTTTNSASELMSPLRELERRGSTANWSRYSRREPSSAGN